MTSAPVTIVPAFHPDEREHRRLLAFGLTSAINDQGLPPRYAVVTPQLDTDQAAPAYVTLSAAVKVRGMAVGSELFFTVIVPHGFVEKSDIVPHVRWCPRDNSGGDVAWTIDLAYADVGGLMTTATGTVTAVAGEALSHTVTTMPALTVNSISAAIVGRIARTGGSHVPAAGLLALDFLVPVDAKGSQDVFLKYAEQP